MVIENLRLRAFRRIAAADLQFEQGTNLLLGENAQGKTTVLEAVCFAARGRSFRTRRDRDCLPSGQREADSVTSVEAIFHGDAGRREVRVALDGRLKALFLDGKPVRRLAELVGLFPIVTFTPEDLLLIRGGPGERRAYLDGLLAAESPATLQALQDYATALKEKNSLLRRHNSQDSEMDAWDDQLAVNGARIMTARLTMIDQLASRLARHMERLAPEDQPLAVSLEDDYPQPDDSEPPTEAVLREWLRERLAEQRNRDRERGSTSVGPHRADLGIQIGELDCRQYASQGQARSLALGLRLAERDILEERLDTRPILLLDDVLGELDKRRTAHFVSILSNQSTQAILTATDAAALGEEMPVKARFHVTNGSVGRAD